MGPEGGLLSSTVVPQVQAIFPEGALTKKIRVGLQVGPPPYLAQAETLSEADQENPGPGEPPPPNPARSRLRRLLRPHKRAPATHGDRKRPPRKAGFFAQLVRRTWPRLAVFSHV